MGISYRKRIKVNDDTYLNLSKSGVSISKKVGNTTFNTRNGLTINFGNGVVYRQPHKKSKKK